MNAGRRLFDVFRRALPWALMVGGIVWFSGSLRPSAAFEVGKGLPPLKAKLLDGTSIDISQPAGTAMVLNFWASYCGPCRAEAPLLSALAERGVRVIGLSVDARSPDELRAMTRDMGMTYPTGFGGPLVKEMRVRTIPTTYVLSSSGAIVLSRVGKVSESDLNAAVAIAKRQSSAR